MFENKFSFSDFWGSRLGTSVLILKLLQTFIKFISSEVNSSSLDNILLPVCFFKKRKILIFLNIYVFIGCAGS